MNTKTHVVDSAKATDVTINCDRACRFRYWCETPPLSGSPSGFSNWSNEAIKLEVESFPHTVSLPYGGKWLFEWEVTDGDRPVFKTSDDETEKQPHNAAD